MNLSGAGAAPAIAGDPWYGNINYLLNLSLSGAGSCVLLFLLLKLRSDHRSFPTPSALFSKLLSAYHAHLAPHSGADAAQFLLSERSSFLLLLSLSIPSLLTLPLNISAHTATLDQFARTTITNIPSGSPLLWVHFSFMVGIVVVAHFGISRMEEKARLTRFSDFSSSNEVAMFAIMVQGVPEGLAADKTMLVEYFQHRYPGKVFRVVVPFDLCELNEVVGKWVKVREGIRRLEDGGGDSADGRIGSYVRGVVEEVLGFTDKARLRRLCEMRLVLEAKMREYKEGRAQGAGIAFVVFRDVYTTNKAVRDFQTETGSLSLMEMKLERKKWRVERAPPASDIYWNHLGVRKLSLRLYRGAVNTCLLLMLLFFSSPLAVISAMKTAARIVNAEAMDNAEIWLSWIEGSSWFGTVVLQFMPNVLIFVSMYIIVPSALSYLSKYERHLTVSGEQRAALLKMVCFFLVNLILLRAMVESSLESAILRMGRCYLDGEDCKRIEQYMSPSFLSRSCVSSLAFLIASTFLGISFDLLAPIPWIKKTLRKFRKNDMIQLVPEQREEYPLEQDHEQNNLREPLVLDRQDSPVSNSLEGHDLSIYPVNRNFHVPKQTFDFAQYYAFNLTIFALTMIYCLFAPLVVPVGAFYFGYRCLVDKYNFLYVYRVQGFAAGNDGKLIDRVLCIMRFCVVLFLLSMVMFFSVNGDSTKLQAIFTLGLLFAYKVLPSRTNIFQPSVLEGMQSVDSFVDGPTDYEVFSQPNFDWDTYQH